MLNEYKPVNTVYHALDSIIRVSQQCLNNNSIISVSLTNYSDSVTIMVVFTRVVDTMKEMAFGYFYIGNRLVILRSRENRCDSIVTKTSVKRKFHYKAFNSREFFPMFDDSEPTWYLVFTNGKLIIRGFKNCGH
jgi:hypothetical protein